MVALVVPSIFRLLKYHVDDDLPGGNSELMKYKLAKMNTSLKAA